MLNFGNKEYIIKKSRAERRRVSKNKIDTRQMLALKGRYTELIIYQK